MAQPFTIRAAARADAEALAHLCRQLGYEVAPAAIAAQLASSLPPDFALFVAEAESVLGWITVQKKISLHAGCFAEITGLVVDEAARGQGIGAALLNRAEQWAEECGISAVWLRSNITREAAHEFYPHRGYELVKTSYTFKKRVPHSVACSH
jgi:GNAT superfamily N-acetyltransferase